MLQKSSLGLHPPQPLPLHLACSMRPPASAGQLRWGLSQSWMRQPATKQRHEGAPLPVATEKLAAAAGTKRGHHAALQLVELLARVAARQQQPWQRPLMMIDC